MGEQIGVSPVLDWDPFQEDSELLCDIAGTEAGITLLACRSADDGLIGFGRVHVVGGSPRLSKLLIGWGWTRLPQEERSGDVQPGLCVDVPIDAAHEIGLTARTRSAEAFANTLNETFEMEGASFFARGVRIELTDQRAEGKPEGFERGDEADLLIADPLRGWSDRDVWALMVDRAVAALRAEVPSAEPAGWVLAEVAARLKRLEDVRWLFGLGLPAVPTPELAVVRRMMTAARDDASAAV